MVVELLSEVAHEVSADPLRFAAEVVQFLLLVALVWVVAFGFGKRRGFVTNMLAERRRATRGSLEMATSSIATLEQAQNDATTRLRSARTEARRLMAEAKRKAKLIETQAKSEADAEAERIASRTEDALATELAEMHVDVREQLVDLVAQATRSVMNERLTLAEQRRLIEDAVLASVSAPDERHPDETPRARRPEAVES